MDPLAELVGESPQIDAVRDQIRRLLVRREAGRRLPAILITGETGSGKGLVADLLVRNWPVDWRFLVSTVLAATVETVGSIVLLRWDINVRESAVLGLAGAGGTGLVLDAAINVFQ